MAYEKRVCVMKQLKKGFSADGGTLSGALYCERLNSRLTVTPRIMGLSPLKEGRYVLVLGIGKSVLCGELKSGPLILEDTPSIKAGLSALLCFVRGEAEPLAFGSCGNSLFGQSALLAALSEQGGRKKPAVPLPPVQQPSPLAPNVPYAPGVPLPDDDPPFQEGASAYDDEAIADADYFARAQDDADEEVGMGSPEEKGTAAGGGHPAEDEDAHLVGGSLTYYKEVRSRLEAVMKKYPQDTRLKGAFPHSEWVRSEEALLGIVYGSGIPRYLCVAVEKKGPPPEEMKENCVFVPASPFSQEEGFYVVFQDADTGAYVKVYDS